jgi:magnesium transporter
VTVVGPPPTRRLVAGGAPSGDATDEAITGLLEEERFFWLDILGPDPADRALMAGELGFHPLAIEDAEKFGQRPKLEEYDDYVVLVAYGAGAPDDEDRLVEVHCFYSERYLVTVRHEDCPAFSEVRDRCATLPPGHAEGGLLLHRVLDALTDSFFPLLSEMDEELDRLDVESAASAEDHTQSRIYALKRRLIAIRKVVLPQRDLMGRIASGTAPVPGLTVDARRYFRDVQDHLIRIGEMLDAYRELLSGATEVYLSNVSNRLNVVMKQLTALAGIFLPLTFVTGFFGQNFAWMVDQVGGPGWFFVLGIGVQVVLAVSLVKFFRHKGWL